MQSKVNFMVGAQIRQARTNRNLSLNEVASRAKISVATLSRIERDKQGLELGLFITLCRILKAAPQELLGGDDEGEVDPLVIKIAAMSHSERLQLWRDLAAVKKNDRRSATRSQMRNLGEQFEELLAQLELVRAEIEAAHSHARR